MALDTTPHLNVCMGRILHPATAFFVAPSDHGAPLPLRLNLKSEARNPETPVSLNEGLKWDPQYDLSYIPQLRDIGVAGKLEHRYPGALTVKI